MAETPTPKWSHYCGDQGGWRPGRTEDCHHYHRVRLAKTNDRLLDEHWKIK